MLKLINATLIMSAVLSFCCPARADTVIFRNGERAKGLILEEFKDRIVFSTAEGEKELMKSDIRSAIYDSEQKALLQKARNQFKKGHFIKAYYAYEKILDLDPNAEEAQERLYYLKNYLGSKTRGDINHRIANKKLFSDNEQGTSAAERVVGELGFVLSPGEKYVFIKEIKNGGLADKKTGLGSGDRIVEVWGEMTAYMDEDEVSRLLLGSGESRFIVEKTVVSRFLSSSRSLFDGLLWSRYKRIIGAGLRLQTDGIVVGSVSFGGPFEAAGIRRGDLLYRINGVNTRYLPMSKIIDIVRNNQDKEVELVVRRDITLWKKEDDI